MTQHEGPPRNRRHILKGLALLPAAGLAGACETIVPGQGPPPILYRLTPKSTFGPEVPSVKWQLVLEPPLANAGLNTTRIARWPNPRQLEYYARANWTDRAPNMFQTLLIESFENSGKIVSVGRGSLGLRADFVLKTEMREFQADYDAAGNPSAHIGIHAKLVKMPSRSIIGSEKFDRIVPARADSLDDIIEAFDDALGKVLKRIVSWVLVTGQQNYKRRG